VLASAAFDFHGFDVARTLGENLRLAEAQSGSHFLGSSRWGTFSDAFGLAGLLDSRVGSLSLGTRAKARLAVALSMAERLLVLDEPTNALDLSHRAAFYAALPTLMAERCSVLIATHEPEQFGALPSGVVSIVDLGGTDHEVLHTHMVSSGRLRARLVVRGSDLHPLPLSGGAPPVAHEVALDPHHVAVEVECSSDDLVSMLVELRGQGGEVVALNATGC
jgi:ABC-type sugar transport system ATPase subunit